MKVFTRTLALGLALAAGPALSGPFSDLVMAPGVLAEVPAGPVFRYAHNRHLAVRAEGSTQPKVAEGEIQPKAVAEGEVILTAEAGEGGMRLILSRRDGGQTAPVAEFSGGGPNPVLLYFLENTVRVVAAETGGSPYYIRNRIREALAAADLPAPGTALTLSPFAADKNRDKMGDFGTLALHLTFDPGRPARLVELKADTAAGTGGYTETLTLIAEE